MGDIYKFNEIKTIQIANLGDWRFLFRDFVSSAQTVLKYDTLRAEKVRSKSTLIVSINHY